MSNKERCVALLDNFTEAQLVSVAAMLENMTQTQEEQWDEIPNAATIAAMREVEEMIRTGGGEHWSGSTEDFFAMLDREAEEDA